MSSGREDQQLVPELVEPDGAVALDSGKVRTNHGVYQSEGLVCYVDLVQAYWFPPLCYLKFMCDLTCQMVLMTQRLCWRDHLLAS